MVDDVTVHDRSGLLLGGSPAATDAEINQVELLGLGAARAWIHRTRLDVTQVPFWQRLHREMFGEVWAWAGAWRHDTTNVGVAARNIQPELRKLEDDLAYWLSDACEMACLEVLSRFHHRAVWVHPFNNGNGRWARLATDAIAVRRYAIAFLNWAEADKLLRSSDSAERKTYIAAIKAGDNGDLGPLMEYLRDRNPGT